MHTDHGDDGSDGDDEPLHFEPIDKMSSTTHVVICTRRWIGRVAAEGYVLTISHKPYVQMSSEDPGRDAACRMVTPRLKVSELGSSDEIHDYGYLLAALFANRLSDALIKSRGVISDYQTIRRSLPYVRGRIDFIAQLKRPRGFATLRSCASSPS